MNRAKVAKILFYLSMPIDSYAIPADLACKVYGDYLSAQMYSQEVKTNGVTKTLLSFRRPISFYPETLDFELVYSSGYKINEPLTLVGSAVDSNGVAQTVQIVLDAPTADDSTRYGTARAGDLISGWQRTIGKHKSYKIQCSNF